VFARPASACLPQFLSRHVRWLSGYGSRLTPMIYLHPTLTLIAPAFVRLVFASSPSRDIHQPRLCHFQASARLTFTRHQQSSDPDCVWRSRVSRLPISGSSLTQSTPSVRAFRVRPHPAVVHLSSLVFVLQRFSTHPYDLPACNVHQPSLCLSTAFAHHASARLWQFLSCPVWCWSG